LTCLGIVFVARWAVRHTCFGIQRYPYLGHICHGDSWMRDSPRCQEKTRAGFLPRFARLRLGRAVEHGQKKTYTCSTRSAHARARPRPDPAPRRAAPMSPVCACVYKAHPDVDHTLLHALNLTRAQTHRRLPVHGVSAATRAPTAVDRPTKSFPTPSDPRRRLSTPQ
jgi:hypothetical protein